MFKLYEFLCKFFNQTPTFDEDGFAHFLLEEMDGDLDVDITPITQWDTLDLNNKLILDCDAAATFALSWMSSGCERLQIQPVQVRDVKFLHETHEYINGSQQDLASLEFYFKEIPGRLIRLQLLPHLSVQFAVDVNDKDFMIMN